MTENGNFYRIITSDGRRRRQWQQLFSCEELPVKAAAPRLQLPPVGKPNEVMAYDLDAARLPPGAAESFARYLSRRTAWDFETALLNVDGWPITSYGCLAVASLE